MIRFHARAKLHMVQQPTQLHYTSREGGWVYLACHSNTKCLYDIDWCDSNHFLLDWRVMQTQLS